MTSQLRRRVIVAGLSVLALLIAGCATRAEEPAPAAGPNAAFPVDVSPPGGEPVTIDAEPDRIVSLSPSSTEVLFAIGAGDQVVAVDDQSSFPAEAPRTELSGFTPNVEAISTYDPDLVVASEDLGDLVAGLDAAGIPVLLLPAPTELAGTYTEISVLGQATGQVDEATALTEEMRAEIDELVAGVPEFPEPPSYFHELDPTLYTVTSDTFIGSVYELFGLRNIADEAPDDAAGYPQLSAEAILQADPDLIFLADTQCCAQDGSTLAARPGFGELTAVREGSVVELDDDIASRWGPRVVELAREVADALEQDGPR